MKQPQPPASLNDIATEAYEAISTVQNIIRLLKQKVIEQGSEIVKLKSALEKAKKK